MHPSHQQPDFGALPIPPSMPSPASSQGRGPSNRQVSHDTNMDDFTEQSEDNPQKLSRGLNLNFFKTKPAKTTKEGVPARKRGPKRDAKPALSRRQELNRQAQRTHRERKEVYTKSLECQVTSLRDLYTNAIQEKEAIEQQATKIEQTRNDANIEVLRHENDRLKQLLRVNGIAFERVVPLVGAAVPTSSRQSPSKTNEHAAVQPGHSQSFKREAVPLHDQLSRPTSNSQANYQQQSQSISTSQRRPSHHHTNHSNCQHGIINGQQQLSVYQNGSFSSNPLDTHPAYRQQNGGTTDFASSNLQQENSISPISPVTPTLGASQSDYANYPQSSSFSGSSFGTASSTPSVPSLQSPTYADSTVSRQISHHDPSGIDSIISDSASSTFRPPLGQGLVDGRVVRNTSDERIKQQQMDHDQLGISFVLALEETCKDHQGFLTQRANPPNPEDANVELSGHAMMLTNPSPSFIATNPNGQYHQPSDMAPGSLMRLMVSEEVARPFMIVGGGEVTPVLALQIIRDDERYGLLTTEQFQMITQNLRRQSRCYGFGAVLEAYEVRDAIDTVFEPFNKLSLNNGQYTA